MELIRFIKDFSHQDDGVTAIEYGLIAALIAVAIIGGTQLLGTNLNALFNAIAALLVFTPGA